MLSDSDMGIGEVVFKPIFPSQYLSLTPYIGTAIGITRARKIKINLIEYFFDLKSCRVTNKQRIMHAIEVNVPLCPACGIFLVVSFCEKIQ
ncbi:hypothetical protein CFF01_05165 [Shewanella marisflavi]|uniref:Uncharacterized protein n=1 Tax=Shewanella marisflavi TaxID=260364 RepID=A0AAC9TYU3_9GAMM|nr:hypothetical protein CFF01_05165 [Shewanella marisflavi]